MIRLNLLKQAAIAAGVLLFGFAGATSAQQPTQAQIGAIKQSCRSDYQANCSGVPTGGSAALQCLQGHVANLSPSCQTAVNATMGGGTTRPPPQSSSQGSSQSMPPAAPPPAMSPRDEMMLVRRSCGGDFRAYCQGVRLGGGRALSCLAANEQRLSPPCQGALAEARGSR
jgi:hypothetical protein